MSAKHEAKRGVSRRTFLAGTAAIAAAAAPGMPWVKRALADQEFAGKEIRVLTWSDPTGQAAVKNILKPFMAKTGARIVPDLTGATSQMVE